MASIYKREDSPYFWIKFKDANGRIKQESTRCRTNVAPEVRRARQMEAEKTAEEWKRGDLSTAENGWAWVVDFLGLRYHSSPASRERYLSAWASINLFLTERKIESPRHFRREHCFNYMTWRQEPDKKNGKYRACHNTALMELKTLRVIMEEAVIRGIITGNPCVRLKIKKEPQKEKPELTAQDCEAIRNGIEAIADTDRREMLSNSFEIARHQGCRLSETKLNPMTDVDLKAGTIRFRTAKGGKDHMTALHPALIDLFTKLQADQRASTWKVPANSARQWASATWWKFLDKLGLKARGITFHGTRVTVISEMARADVHESKAMSYVGHAGPTVHRIYQRLRPSDLAACTDAVGSGKSPSSAK